MRLPSTRMLGLCCLLTAYNNAMAEPWLTGPLLAPAGHTIPAGHTNFELYNFYTDSNGFYNRHGRLTHSGPANISDVINPVFSHGLTDKMDVQLGVPYAFNHQRKSSYHHISDVGITLGYQLLEQKDAKWRPDIRFTVQEIIPTGKFEHLDPVNNGTDSTGSGSYQTAAGITFQLLTAFNDINYLRTRVNLNYIYAANTSIHGISSYGGTPETFGTIDPGDIKSIDIAGEFTLTQHWVAVMETYLADHDRVRFKGYPGVDSKGNPVKVGNNSLSDQATLAPAIEYNFNANVGVIAGMWFIVKGRETAEFKSAVVALNAYW